MIYTIRRASGPVKTFAPDAPEWQHANVQKLEATYPENQGGLLDVTVRLLYDDACIYGLYHVEDDSVRALRMKDQDSVCKDSCVEFFIQPPGDGQYFNFEFSCIGTLLLYKVRNCAAGDYDVLPLEDLKTVKRFSQFPHEPINPERQGNIPWNFGFAIPIALLVKYFGCDPKLAGQKWRGNFYKCGDDLSKPRWIAWCKTGELNFHMPEYFGEFRFEA